MRNVYWIIIITLLSSCGGQRGLSGKRVNALGTITPPAPPNTLSSVVTVRAENKIFYESLALTKNAGLKAEGLAALSSQTGNNFCFSNEKRGPATDPDLVNCFKPFTMTENNGTLNSQNAAYLTDFKNTARLLTGRTPVTSEGFPSIVNAFQLYFSAHRASLVSELNEWSTVQIDGLYLKTAPIRIDNNTGNMYWDKADLQTLRYLQNDTGTGNFFCDSTSQDYAVGIKIPASLDNSTTAFDERQYYFVSAIGVLERKYLKAFEEIDPTVNSCTRAGSQNHEELCGLFSTRTKVWNSFVMPTRTGDEIPKPNFELFPRANNAAIQSTFGLYREQGTLPTKGTGSTTIPEGDPSPYPNGIYFTPPMGKNVDGFNRRAIVEFCIRGTRSNYEKRVNGSTNQVETIRTVVPLVKSLRYELRKFTIKVPN